MTHVFTPRRPLRSLVLPAVIVVGVGLAGPGTASAAAKTSKASKASIGAGVATVTRGVCTTSVSDAQQRSATFNVGVRDFTKRATSYGFRARLQERVSGGGWTTLTGAQAPEGLGAWQDAQPGAAKMVRKITVRSLRPGSTYRLRVDYRWFAGGVRTDTTKTSRSCPIQDLRPNVAIAGAIGWVPGTIGDQVGYRVPVTASGLATLRTTDVIIEIRQGTALLGRSAFRPTSGFEVALVPGRRCISGQPITVTLDPDHLIDEQNELDNTVTVPCQPATR